MFVLDSHCDTPSQIFRLRDLALDNDHAHVDFPKLARGGVDGAFFALYVPASMDSDPEAAWNHAESLYKGVIRTLAANPDKAALALDPVQAYENQKNDRFSVFIGLENGSPVGRSLGKLAELYDMGVRYMTLCHSGNNEICDSCAPSVKRWGGLSPFGKEVVKEMNRLGMLIDVSHASDDTFYDVLKYSTKPVVATHSCCRALCSHPRNMTDGMIRALAAAGGVIQINFYPLFLDDDFAVILSSSGMQERGESIESEFIADPADNQKRAAWNAVQDELQALCRPSFKLIADHIDHVAAIAGVDHVGLGSDFDGIEVTPDGMEDVSYFYKIINELRSRGYSEEDLDKIAGGNFFRVMQQNQA
jgi:membrane dipeptidase